MKTRYYILFLGMILSFGSCEIDNYDKPEARFSGAITYEGDTIRVAYNDVRFELWQSGFGNEGPMDVHVAQDGSFNSLLFKGDYRLNFIDGPFKPNFVSEQQGDSIYLDINGDTNMNLEVTPYYMVRNPQFSLSGNNVQSSINLEQVVTDEDAKDIDHVTLYLNTTQFVSPRSDGSIARVDADLTNLDNLSMAVSIPENVRQDYIFARVGVRISGVEDMIFTRVEKLKL